MKLLGQYLGRQMIQTTLLVVLILLGIDLFFYLVNELRFVGKGQYNLAAALLFVLMTIPRKVYILFPWAALLGTLLSLGALAKQSELVAMRSFGISVYSISWALLKAALLMTVCLFIAGEVIAPPVERFAQQHKTRALSSGQTLHTQHGSWMRSGESFIHIGRAVSVRELHDVTLYKLAALKLQEVEFFKTVKLYNDTWRVADAVGTEFAPQQTKLIAKQDYDIKASNFLDQELLQAAGVKHLERLSLYNLWKVIKERNQNNLNEIYY